MSSRLRDSSLLRSEEGDPLFSKREVGSTLPLPCAPIGNWSQPVAVVSACSSRLPGLPICHRLPLVATARLHKRSIFAARIPDEKGNSGPVAQLADALSAGMSLERAVQTRSEASCSDSRSAIMIVAMWTNPEGTSDIRLMSDYVSTTRRSSYTGTGRLKPFISSCTAGCASTESSKAENARWLRRICPAAAASLSLAARLVTGPSTP